ncbi:F0F1 ATP synthase subunit B [Paraburkholderia sp. UYCP14C]|uniref:F0F1 ATP synthase subunit B family protein n=1 Tax=Paraburkholderia sp. UYCP14C TaxID=2511130 RepID=UPI001020E364|nr:F0F1 ATP synthase subunit B [Paraburkholderia sp. UYCP14C]RZF27504.1 F0F1 ATP synthase subunit B [Paraburkholderia sp. UYCP14C]
MKIDWSTLALQTLNALILIWLLARFLFRPIAKIIAERQASANALTGDANAAKLAAQAERDALRAEREQLAAQRAQAFATIEADARTQHTALLDAARDEAERLRTQAAADRQRERAAQDEAASAAAAQLAVDIAGKLLDQLLDRSPQDVRVAGFIDGLADGVRRLSPGARAALAADAPLRVTAPRALTPDERTACETALAAAFAERIGFDTDIDRTLLAGLELSGAHAVVRNSWRDQLEQIRVGLLCDDGHAR